MILPTNYTMTSSFITHHKDSMLDRQKLSTVINFSFFYINYCTIVWHHALLFITIITKYITRYKNFMLSIVIIFISLSLSQ